MPFPEEYLVSNDGRIYSKRSKRIIKPNHDRNGYLYYVLCVKGNHRTVKAHRMVAQAFIPNPLCKPTVNHINGVRDDNRVENLEWATNKEQSNDPNTAAKLAAAHSRTDYRAMGERRNFGRKEVVITWPDGRSEVFPSLLCAAKSTGVNYAHLSGTLNGNRPQRKEFCIAVTKKHFPERGDADE